MFKYDQIEKNTHSFFCPNTSVIRPYNNNDKLSTALIQENSKKNHDVILEKDEIGNTYLHLVMPADSINFLNGSDGSNLFDFADTN